MGVIRNESPQAASKYTGKGDAAFKIKFPKTGAVVFKFKYVGKSNFIVTIYDKNGKLDDLLANEINDYTGETMFSAGSGDYYIEVIATGDWTIQIT
jgi:predicted RNA-binding protein associated with RNAse of E/G family